VDTPEALGKYCPAGSRREGFPIAIQWGTRPMPRFDLQRFLAETGLSIAKLASHLQVAQTYLQKAAGGKADLTRRDREACRTLWRRLTQAAQIELPFAEPPETFTREHARRVARSGAKSLPGQRGERAALPGRPRKGTDPKTRPAGGKQARGTDSRRRKEGKGKRGPRIGGRKGPT
jgi:hypothetical protein